MATDDNPKDPFAALPDVIRDAFMAIRDIVDDAHVQRMAEVSTLRGDKSEIPGVMRAQAGLSVAQMAVRMQRTEREIRDMEWLAGQWTPWLVAKYKHACTGTDERCEHDVTWGHSCLHWGQDFDKEDSASVVQSADIIFTTREPSEGEPARMYLDKNPTPERCAAWKAQDPGNIQWSAKQTSDFSLPPETEQCKSQVVLDARTPLSDVAAFRAGDPDKDKVHAEADPEFEQHLSWINMYLRELGVEAKPENEKHIVYLYNSRTYGDGYADYVSSSLRRFATKVKEHTLYLLNPVPVVTEADRRIGGLTRRNAETERGKAETVAEAVDRLRVWVGNEAHLSCTGIEWAEYVPWLVLRNKDGRTRQLRMIRDERTTTVPVQTLGPLGSDRISDVN